jgi:hypothetical protein
MAIRKEAMSYFVVVDDVEYGQVANVKGWSDFIEWADDQPYEELRHLIHHGFATELQRLADEITKAIRKSKPHPDVKSIGKDIAAIAKMHPDGKVLIITDGADDDSEDDYGPDEEGDIWAPLDEK